LVFEENAIFTPNIGKNWCGKRNFYAEFWQKMQKIVIITSTPFRFPASRHAEREAEDEGGEACDGRDRFYKIPFRPSKKISDKFCPLKVRSKFHPKTTFRNLHEYCGQ
jgi:hypothetical protein